MENRIAGPMLKSHTFEAVISENPVTFHVLRMTDCLFLWIGDMGTFDSLAVAMVTPYSSIPTPSVLLGHSAEDGSSSLASRLSKKTGKQVFVSCNLSKKDEGLVVGVTQRLMKELTENPDKF